MKVLLDAGHGRGERNDSGAVAFGKEEADYTARVAVVACNCLNKIFGIDTYITRAEHPKALHDTHYNPVNTPKWRLEDAKNIGATLFVSIHWNKHFTNASGTEVLFTKDTKANRNLATTILAQILTGLAHYDKVKQIGDWNPKSRGVKQRGLGVLRQSIPCCLVECEFLSNIAVNACMEDKSFIWTLGYSIAKGIASYLGVTEDVNLATHK